ncbi:HAD family hydrolase [Brevibacillus ruminantium]|uniref:HAD family hydrolase n=1 Tax=Brevibacillus ruminantium TaxID=2950604 RepID=A0ABY4WNR7_9BACL|nr:HAD family hydrolase [Brevibacillus ruminantium]USG68499.1 HAD family hydrolase [Brevibacillus ruminantium]
MIYKLILFDLDDTLFDYSQCFEEGMRQTIGRHRLSADLDHDSFYRKLKAYSDELWPDLTQNRISLAEYRFRRLEKTAAHWGRTVAEEVAKDFQQMFLLDCFDTIKPIPEVERCLRKLAASHQLGIVTNGPEDMAFTKIERLGLSHLFSADQLIISERVGYHKPDRRIFTAALERFGTAPKETLFVGDSWEADVAGAIDAGMDAVWINPKKLQPASNHLPLAVVERLEQLTDVLA